MLVRCVVFIREIEMKKLILGLGLLLLASVGAHAATIHGLYVQTFGDPSARPLVYIHGGPGHHSYDFELTTAAELSKRGYYVVVYDQRGQGRSAAAQWTEFTYQTYASDLAEIISTLKLEKPILLGHSHGGPIAIQFDRYHPGVAGALVLVSAPVNFWSSMLSMKAGCEKRGVDVEPYFKVLASTVDENTRIDAIGEIFMAGFSKCQLYSVAQPTAESFALMHLLYQNPLKISDEQAMSSMPGFFKNENYIYLDHSIWVRKSSTPIYGIYGDEDGLFDQISLEEIRQLVGGKNSNSRFQVLKGASHAVFIDQQKSFLEALDRAVESDQGQP